MPAGLPRIWSIAGGARPTSVLGSNPAVFPSDFFGAARPAGLEPETRTTAVPGRGAAALTYRHDIFDMANGRFGFIRLSDFSVQPASSKPPNAAANTKRWT